MCRTMMSSAVKDTPQKHIKNNMQGMCMWHGGNLTKEVTLRNNFGCAKSTYKEQFEE